MRELPHKDVKRIAIYTSRYYQSLTKYPLKDNSIRAIKYIIARDYLSRHFSEPNTVFDPSAHSVLQIYLKAMDINLTSEETDIDVLHDKELAKLSELNVKQVFLDEDEFPSLSDKTDLKESQTSEDQLSQQSTELMPIVENDKISDEATLQVFDHSVLKALYEKSAMYDKEIKRVIREIDPNDTGVRKLQRATPEIIERIHVLKDKYPNMLPFLDFVDRHAALSEHNKYREFYMPPVLLVSKPGLGKTSCVKDVAAALAVPFDFVDYSTCSAAWILVGVSSVWNSAKPGLIFEQLVKQPICNGLILCDEIDKSPNEDKYPPINVFYKLLEKDLMVGFQDEFIPQLSLNASKLMYVATANNIAKIPKAILSRFHIINISPPSSSQLRVVTGSIYRSIIEQEAYQLFAPALKDEVVEHLLDYSPRQIKVALKLAFASAAYRCRHKKNDIINIEVEDLELPELEDESRQIGFVWH